MANRSRWARPDEAALYAARYPAGATVTVFYDPLDPANRSRLDVDRATGGAPTT